MRSAFINWLCERAADDPSILLLTADLGFSVVEPFAQAFPSRFINVGVAEQNMVGIAAGLASEGFRPYTYSIGIFPSFRCAEQLRNDIDYHQLPVVTSTVGSGVTYGSLGYTHHMIQDLALIRSLPHTIIATPSDPLEVRAILDWQLQNPCPLYLRMHKAGDPILHPSQPTLTAGDWLHVDGNCLSSDSSQSKIAVVVIGALCSKIIPIVQQYAPSVSVYTIPLWGQCLRDTQIPWLTRYEHVITVEDHLADAGFGSWILETAALSGLATRVHPVALSHSAVGVVAQEKTLLEPLLALFAKTLSSLISA